MNLYDLYETVESVAQEVTDVLRHWRYRYYYEDPDRAHMLDHYYIINLRVAYILSHC